MHEFVPIQKQRAFEQILAQLQQMILRGELRPGDRLPNERSLAVMLGVGRPSLREALRALEALEIIETRPGFGAASGSVITDQMGSALPGLLSMHMALGHFSHEELVQTRLVLETWTVRMAALNRTAEQLAIIEGLLDELESSEGDQVRYLAIDARFHLAIAESAGNPLLSYLMQALRAAMVDQMTTQTSAWDDWTAVIAWAAPDHRNLFEAIVEQDAEGAERVLRHHLAFYGQPVPN